MFDVLDFIDSSDVREYNRDTAFTPLEKAVIVNLSRTRTLYEKLAAWEELLAAYPEEDFVLPRFPNMPSDKDTVEEVVERYHRIIDKAADNDGVVFGTEIWKWEDDVDGSPLVSLFSDYSRAMDRLISEKQQYAADEVTGARIVRYTVDSDERYCYEFDNEMRLTEARDGYDDIMMSVYRYKTRLGLPFKKGDLVKLSFNGETSFGVLREDCPWITGGDVITETYEWDRDEKVFGTGFTSHPEAFRRADESELPAWQRNLLLMREVYRGRLSAGEMLHYLNIHGDGAYDAFCKYH